MNAQSTLEKLNEIIETVRNTPGIYNYNHGDFAVFERREECWEHVANSVNLKVQVLKNRWRVLRDRYVRYQRKLMLGRIDVNQVRFPFFEQMKFLDPFIKRRHPKRLTRSSTSSSKSEKVIKTQNSKIVKIKNSVGSISKPLCNEYGSEDEDAIISLQNNYDDEEIEKSENKINNHFRRGETVFVDSASPFDESVNQEKMQCSQDDNILDEDDLFGKSLGMSLRKLSRLNNVRAKVEVFQVLQKYIEFEEV